MPRYFFRLSASLSAFFLCTLLVLLSACGSPGKPGAVDKGDSAPVLSQPSATAIATSPAVIPTVSAAKICPASGTARAATLPALQLGKDQSIVSISNTGDAGQLQRFDVQTKTTTTILSLSGESIENAQLSRDGQWILFSGLVGQAGPATIQLVRVDGQHLQTLYCTQPDLQNPLVEMQWSPDQKNILFIRGDSSYMVGAVSLFPQKRGVTGYGYMSPRVGGRQPESLYLLQLASSRIQTEMSFSAQDPAILPATWLDNTHVYVTSGLLNGTITELYLLNTGNGYNQHFSDLQLIKSDGDGLGFSSSYDGSKLFILSDDLTSGSKICKIEVMSATGANRHTIFSGFPNTWILLGVSVIGYSSTSLLFHVEKEIDTSSTQNKGLWRINADGTGLTRLRTDDAGPGNRSSQYPWSIFSRDGAFYAADGSYGSLSGEAMVKYTNDNVSLVGWTTM